MDSEEIHLETKRLILRRWRDSDAGALYKYASNPAIGPIAGWEPHKTVEHSLEVIRTVFSAPEVYAVVLKETNDPVGSIGVLFPDAEMVALGNDDYAEIGYWIGEPYWGRGLIPEALKCLIKRCFVDLGLKTVWCSYNDGNNKSKRVMEKCGFRYHHTNPNVMVPLVGVTSQHFMSLTLSQWREIQSQSAT